MCSTSMFLFMTPKFEFISHEYLKQEEVIFKYVSSWFFFIVKTLPTYAYVKTCGCYGYLICHFNLHNIFDQKLKIWFGAHICI